MLKKSLLALVMMLGLFFLLVVTDRVPRIQADGVSDCQNIYKECLDNCTKKSLKDKKFKLSECKNECKEAYEECVKEKATENLIPKF